MSDNMSILLLQGLNAALTNHVGSLFEVLNKGDSDGLKRFEAGIRKSLKSYGDAVDVIERVCNEPRTD